MKPATTIPRRFAAPLAAAALLVALGSPPPASAGIRIDADTGDGEIEIDGDEVVVETAGDEARITPAGDLFVDGRRVRVGERDQRDLVRYNEGMRHLEELAVDIGLQGAGLAVSALGEAFAAALTGDEQRAERRIEARAGELEADALELCDELRRLERIQDRLATNVPAFRPFAVVEVDADDCTADD